MKDAARERFHDIANTETVQYVRANPMPTAMIGIGLAGLAWLAFGRETHDTRSRDWDGRRDWRVRSGYEFERDRQLPGDQMDYEVSARPRGAVREESRHLVQQTRQTARRAQSTLRRTWDENPFLIGAAAAVVGALVAASVPATESENRLMGEPATTWSKASSRPSKTRSRRSRTRRPTPCHKCSRQSAWNRPSSPPTIHGAEAWRR